VGRHQPREAREDPGGRDRRDARAAGLGVGGEGELFFFFFFRFFFFFPVFFSLFFSS